MKCIKSALVLGFLDWLLPFFSSFFIFPLRKSNFYLFESMMAVILVFAAVLFAVYYFKKLDESSVREGLLLGLLWFVINLAIDLLLFMPKTPMHMSFSKYIRQIGVKYLSIPIITAGFGYLKQKS